MIDHTDPALISLSEPDEPHRAPKALSLPQDGCDLLVGLARIAKWTGLSAGQCRQEIAAGLIPIFRVGRRPGIFALKSEINAAARDARDRFRHRQKPT